MGWVPIALRKINDFLVGREYLKSFLSWVGNSENISLFISLFSNFDKISQISQKISKHPKIPRPRNEKNENTKPWSQENVNKQGCVIPSLIPAWVWIFCKRGTISQGMVFYGQDLHEQGTCTREYVQSFLFKRISKFRSRLGMYISPISASMFLILFLNCS